MTRTASGLCLAAAFAFAVGTAAQEPPTPGQPGKSPAGKADGKTLTLTGCLQQGADASTFTLTNVKVETGASATEKAMEATSGTSGTAAGAAAGTGGATATAAAKTADASATWIVASEASLDLKPHVGHRVQLTGTAVGDMKDHTMKSETKTEGTAKTPAGTVKSEQTAKGELSMTGHKLNAQSVKHIAETCTM